jgi:hypothetical protein
MRKDDNEDIHQKTEDVLKQIQEQMKLTDDVINSARYRKSTTFVKQRPNINSERQNIVKIKDSSLEFVNIDDDFNKKPKDSLFDDVCSICSSKIYYEKYICLVCKDCIICNNCELNHLHPVIKWKNNQLSSLYSIFLFLSYNNKAIQNLNSNNKGGFFGTNKSKYIFKLESNKLELNLKPKENIELPINIINLNKEDIDGKRLKLVLLARNTKDLIVYNKDIESKIRRGESLKSSLSIETNIFSKIYTFTIELYSCEDIEIECNSLSFKLKVLADKDEEQLNIKFKNYPEIIKENKNTKKIIKNIMDNKKIKQDPMTILKYLKENDGDINQTLKLLLSDNSN